MSSFLVQLSYSFGLFYQGIPENVEAPPAARAPASGQPANPSVQTLQQPQPTVPSSGPNANPLDLFPQVV